MFRSALISVALSAAFASSIAHAQERLNSIVVTGTRIDASELKQTPNITLNVQADFVIFQVGYVNASLERAERLSDLERAFSAVSDAAENRDDIVLSIGSADDASPIETVTFTEARYDSGQRAGFNLVVKVYTKDSDDYDQVRERLNAFIDAIPEFGRTQSFTKDQQFLGITDLKRYRPELVTAISDEVTFLTNTFKASEVSVSGLEAQTMTQTVGPLELQIYIPYTIYLTAKGK